MPEQFGDKTQEATPHRRQKAREEGQVPKSQDLVSAALLVGGVVSLQFLGGKIGSYFVAMAERRLSEEPLRSADAATAAQIWSEASLGAAQVVLPLLGIMVVLSIVFNVGQVGFLFLPQKLLPDFNRISPLKGIKRLLSISNFTRLGFGLFKVAIVAGVAAWSLWGKLIPVLHTGELETAAMCAFIIDMLLSTCLKIGVALLILAFLDYLFQRWKHEQDLRMTTQEVREEMKTLEGDPQVKARRRVIQRQMVLNRMKNAVPTADVVVTNPTELAIAIKYDMASMPAPVVVAKGAGVLAQNIRRLALENDIPIVERKPLARALYQQVEINDEIPPDQFAAVAEVLRYVYELKGIVPPQR